MTFTILNTKTEYSFLDSIVKLEEYLEKAQKLGYQITGICDTENLHGAYRFVKEAQKREICPVVGFTGSFLLEDTALSLNLLALNTQGYHNLLKLSTRKNRGEDRLESLLDLLEGVAIVLPRIYANYLEKIPNPERVFIALELDDDPLPQSQSAHALAFPSVRYLSMEDAASLQVLHSIRSMNKMEEDENDFIGSKEFLQRADFYESYYEEICPEALLNLDRLVRGIHYDLDEVLHLPRFDRTKEASQLLREKTEEGLRLLDKIGKIYQERLNHELTVIHQMGFDDYFLIVADCLRFAREKGIYCGMGRGSSAGSLVAYGLGITHLDPVSYNFLFERFLNPERVAMPDIDLDMPDDRRGELLAYMQMRYGSDHVAQVLTFSTFGKRQALRDVGKVFGMSEAEISILTRSINSWNGTLAHEYEHNQRFRAEILRSERLQNIYEFAKKIEGLPRQTSVHASAIVLSDQPLYLYTALKSSESLAITQFDARDIESIGLLKIDFLGLNYLTLLAKLQAKVKEHYQIEINPLEIDLEDRETLGLFRAGNTEGIFQYWRSAARQLLRNLGPTKFEDIANARAIRNPGSSGFSAEFIARRHGKEAVEIIDDSLTEILAPTYGIMIYQEQVMQVTQKFAGFSLGKADILRRAISKRKGSAEFEKLRADFIQGAESLGNSKEKAEKIYDLIVKFAGFGFNRSHAFVYAALAVQIAYFKVHYPDEFYEVYLSNYDRQRSLTDALENGYQPVKSDINNVPYYDKASQKTLRLGLSQMNTFQRPFALWIVENRPFKSFSDFVKRVPGQWQKVEMIAPLIQIGLFDQMESNRGKLLANLDALITFVTTFQMDLFSENQIDFSFREAPDLTVSEKYEIERQLLGVSLSEHPISEWQKKLQGQFIPLSELVSGQLARVLVEVLVIRTTKDRNQSKMAFVEVTDSVSRTTAVFFSESYRSLRHRLEKGKMYLMTGRSEARNDEMQLKVTQVVALEETKESLWIRIENSSKNTELAQVLKNFPGSQQVIINNLQAQSTIQTNFYVEKSEKLLQQLKNLTVTAVFR